MSAPSQGTKRTPNNLIHAASPYLQQHAYNPINWHSWSEHALQLSKAEQKPIFLSIGYSTCYWCHVMERDVFESELIAEFMNQHFICIKVDREERPEIDEIYMVARQLMTKEGGWPNNVFLTPDLKPFYAVGTMASDERYGKWSFPRLTESLHESWVNKREEVLKSADNATHAIEHFLQEKSESAGKVPLDVSLSDNFLSFLKSYDDKIEGGFFNAPKFPHENFILYLLKHHKKTSSPDALEMAKNALEKMACGGIHDWIGGGFHRYAVDKAWRIPHFEKMLYNQALMAKSYEELYQLTTNEYYKDVAEDILEYVQRNMMDASGAFYCALDAETDAVEGAYYVWNDVELGKILTPEELTFFTKVFDREDVPVFDCHGAVDGQVVFARGNLPELAKNMEMSYGDLKARLAPIKAKLLKVREARKVPHLDTKIITAWNGLMIDAFALAGQTFGKPEYIAIADKAAQYLMEKARLKDGRLARVIGHGEAMFDAYLEDYAFLMDGLLSLYRATGKKLYLDETLELFEQADKLFFDKDHASYFYTDGEEHLIVRIKQATDLALPSATAIMIHNMLDLFEITKEDKWKTRAAEILDNYSGHISRAPADYCTMVHALLRYIHM